MTAVEDRTRTLTAPLTASVGRSGRAALRHRLVDGLGALVAPLPAGDPVVVTLPLLRWARTRPDSLASPEPPFAWRPAFVRRSLGLAVVDACADGRFRSPLDAVGPVASLAVERWRETGWRTFHWEPWIAGLADGARAMVLAEAAGWATALWSSLDWSALDPGTRIGGADDQWVCPATHTVRLKGRSDVRVPLAARGPRASEDGNRGAVALVSLSGGCPSPAWREELAYLALVASLRSPSRSVPSRVVGVWPDAGADRVVEVDEIVLTAAADLVVATVTAVAEARLSVAA
jgi:hypothetical protein